MTTSHNQLGRMLELECLVDKSQCLFKPIAMVILHHTKTLPFEYDDISIECSLFSM
jgi:hypothetical protein